MIHLIMKSTPRTWLCISSDHRCSCYANPLCLFYALFNAQLWSNRLLFLLLDCLCLCCFWIFTNISISKNIQFIILKKFLQLFIPHIHHFLYTEVFNSSSGQNQFSNIVICRSVENIERNFQMNHRI